MRRPVSQRPSRGFAKSKLQDTALEYNSLSRERKSTHADKSVSKVFSIFWHIFLQCRGLSSIYVQVVGCHTNTVTKSRNYLVLVTAFF